MIIKYINSLNQEIDLINGNFKMLSKTNFHKYNWKVDVANLQYGTRVKNFTKDAVNYDVSLVHTGSLATRIEDLNNLFEVIDYDVRRNTPGRLVWGDFYINCFALSSSKTPSTKMDATDVSLTFYCPNPFWIRETTKTFNYNTSDDPEAYANAGSNLDYPFDYEFDFQNSLNNIQIINPDYYKSDFRIIFYGPCVNPTIVVGGNVYSVNVTLEASDYLTIDSLKKTIELTSVTGKKTNVFHLRDKEHYIFTKIPEGQSVVSWNSDFRFDIVLIEQRSEPKWI